MHWLWMADTVFLLLNAVVSYVVARRIAPVQRSRYIGWITRKLWASGPAEFALRLNAVITGSLGIVSLVACLWYLPDR